MITGPVKAPEGAERIERGRPRLRLEPDEKVLVGLARMLGVNVESVDKNNDAPLGEARRVPARPHVRIDVSASISGPYGKLVQDDIHA